MSVSFVDAVN